MHGPMNFINVLTVIGIGSVNTLSGELFLKVMLFLLQLNKAEYKTFCRKNSCLENFKRRGKAIPVQAWIGPEIFRSLRLPDFTIIGT